MIRTGTKPRLCEYLLHGLWLLAHRPILAKYIAKVLHRSEAAEVHTKLEIAQVEAARDWIDRMKWHAAEKKAAKRKAKQAEERKPAELRGFYPNKPR